MTVRSRNVHATAVVLGTTGVLFVGPSGCGKSMTAFSCIAAAKRSGRFAALVSDDRVLVSQHGPHLMARGFAAIDGLIELRASGIARVPSHPATLLQYAVLPVDPQTAERLPPENESFEVFEDALLPLIRLSSAAPDPLAILSAFMAI